MQVIRLTAVAHVIHYWGFISESLGAISSKMREPWNEEVAKKTMINLVIEHQHAWIGLTIDTMGTPLAFAALQECTPEFDTSRYFVVRWFYHTPSRFQATIPLMEAFETWGRINNIKTYAVTTRRSAGEAIKCFQSARYGFKKAFLTFEKDLN